MIIVSSNNFIRVVLWIIISDINISIVVRKQRQSQLQVTYFKTSKQIQNMRLKVRKYKKKSYQIKKTNNQTLYTVKHFKMVELRSKSSPAALKTCENST